MTGKGMTPAFLEWRKNEILRRIIEGKGHSTVEYQQELKRNWKEEDDDRKRI